LIGIISVGMATRVLFVPGFMQRGDAWRPVSELLPERYPSTVLEHREHTFEGRLAEIADAGEGAVLCGYSLGGRLALRAALAAPERYAGLVLLSATAGIEDTAARTARREADERLAAWIEGASIEDVVGVWERQPLFADQSDELVERQRAGRLSHEPAALASLLRSAGQGVLPPVWDKLPRLRLPLLVVAGGRDEPYCEAARRIAAAVPGARAAAVEDAGHAAHLQRPEEVARLLVDFLDQHLR
jgi:2-succinyl-6-hydroxy-2,4-cyclohexadiene-1-carboxylate synthase